MWGGGVLVPGPKDAAQVTFSKVSPAERKQAGFSPGLRGDGGAPAAGTSSSLHLHAAEESAHARLTWLRLGQAELWQPHAAVPLTLSRKRRRVI